MVSWVKDWFISESGMTLSLTLCSLIISILSTIIAWMAYSFSRTEYYDRKIVLYGKLKLLRSPVHQFLLDTKNSSNIPKMGNIYRVQFCHSDFIKTYGLDKEEKKEFALLNAKHNPAFLNLMGLPTRIEKWYKRDVILYKGIIKEIRLSERELRNAIQNSKELLDHCNLALFYIQKDMPIPIKFRNWRNKHQDKRRTRERNENLKKQKDFAESLEF